MASSEHEVLREAVARNSSAVLSLPSAGILRHHKTRFLAEHEGALVLESVAGEAALIQSLIISEQPCGVVFKTGVLKAVFTCKLLRLEPQWKVNGDTTAAVVVDFPSQIKTTQRRASYRVRVREDSELRVRIWRIATYAFLRDQPVAAQEVAVKLRDVSLGGLAVTFTGKDDQPPKICEADRLRIQLQYQDTTLVLEGRMRKPPKAPEGNTLSTGVQFKKLEDDIQGRQTLAHLTRIVGELQREEVRRHRLGLKESA